MSANGTQATGSLAAVPLMAIFGLLFSIALGLYTVRKNNRKK